MRFAILSATASLLSLAAAQNANAFKTPREGYSLTAGKPTTLNWTPTTPGTVSLYLRSGASSALDKGELIQGSFLFFLCYRKSHTHLARAFAFAFTDCMIEMIFSPIIPLQDAYICLSPISPVKRGDHENIPPLTALFLQRESPTAAHSPTRHRRRRCETPTTRSKSCRIPTRRNSTTRRNS